jgi:uncharacterized membrane protein
LKNFHEYIIQHSLKSGGTKNYFRWAKVPGTAPYWKVKVPGTAPYWKVKVPGTAPYWKVKVPGTAPYWKVWLRVLLWISMLINN